jgi:Protein of unknown function (DUF3617)
LSSLHDKKLFNFGQVGAIIIKRKNQKRGCTNMTKFLLIGAAMLALTSCSDDSADRDGDGTVSSAERSAEMASDGFIPMKAGRWETRFVFNDIDVPTLGAKQKQQIMAEMAKGASSVSCLSAEEAKKPGADFFGGQGADDCTYRTFDVSGQKARLGLTCGMQGMGSVDMDLNGTMNESRFDFDTNVAMRLPMIGKFKLKGTATGRYAGACKGNE